MKRLFALAVAVTALAAQAVTTTWARESAIPANARLRQVASCGDGRIYGIDAASADSFGTLRLLNSGGGSLTTLFGAHGRDSISCVNNTLYHYSRSARQLAKNDGTALGGPLTRVGGAQPADTDRITGGMVLALFIPVPTFVRLSTSKQVSLSTSPDTGVWEATGEAGAAEQIAIGGGFLEHRLYAQNTDDALFENVGKGCNEYWRFLFPGGAPIGRPTVRAIASEGIGKLMVLDDSGAIFRGVITHERQAVTLGPTQITLLNSFVLAGTRLRAHNLEARFTPSAGLAATGLTAETIVLPAADMSLPLGSTRYSPNDINLSSIRLAGSGANLIATAVFEEDGLELLSSNWVYPNINVSSLRGSVTFGGRVGACLQPQVTATAAEFSGNFHGVDNAFSFIIDLMNGDIRNQIQAAMLSGVQGVLAERNTQVSLQGMLLDAAGLLAAPPSGGEWSYIVGNTFQISGGTVRFTVEK